MKTFDELFDRLPNDFKERMKNCMQDPRYHSEGSVYNHSKLVYEELCKMEIIEKFSNGKSLYNSILLSALFHDMGKLDTVHVYEKETGLRVQTIGHENHATKYIVKFASLYQDLNIDWSIVENICEQHMRAHLFLSNEIKKESKRQYFIDRPYLSTFAKADDLGRILG